MLVEFDELSESEKVRLAKITANEALIEIFLNTEFAKYLACNKNLAGKLAKEFYERFKDNAFLMTEMAFNTRNEEILEELSTSKNSDIRVSVCSNPCIKKDTLKRLASDKDMLVRLSAKIELKKRK